MRSAACAGVTSSYGARRRRWSLKPDKGRDGMVAATRMIQTAFLYSENSYPLIPIIRTPHRDYPYRVFRLSVPLTLRVSVPLIGSVAITDTEDEARHEQDDRDDVYPDERGDADCLVVVHPVATPAARCAARIVHAHEFARARACNPKTNTRYLSSSPSLCGYVCCVCACVCVQCT